MILWIPIAAGRGKIMRTNPNSLRMLRVISLCLIISTLIGAPRNFVQSEDVDRSSKTVLVFDVCQEIRTCLLRKRNISPDLANELLLKVPPSYKSKSLAAITHRISIVRSNCRSDLLICDCASFCLWDVDEETADGCQRFVGLVWTSQGVVVPFEGHHIRP